MQSFEGIRVLDFTHVFAGPFATYQLGVMGAEVIKIESPTIPDMIRKEGADAALKQQGLGVSYLANNQGKRAITLDLTQKEGQDIARLLIESADVMVENYTHGLAAYGLGAEQSLEINPMLIYCSMTGFGNSNDYSGRPAYDQVIQAMSGMMSVNGEVDQERLLVGPPLIDYGTGAQAAFAIASALFQRTRTDKGQVIEVNMLDAALIMMSPLVLSAMHHRKSPLKTGNSGSRPGYCVYRCQDEDLMVGAYSSEQHRKLFKVMGLDESVTELDQSSHIYTFKYEQEIRQALHSGFLKEDACHWETILNEQDIPAARVRDLYGVIEELQSRRNPGSQYARLDGNALTMPIAAFSYQQGGPEFNAYCARHGEDTETVLSELGVSYDRIKELKDRKVI